ncbi:hypothetical protein H8356DRAFT_945036, partial [Neocallimastix lanati (nom. inval.)]
KLNLLQRIGCCDCDMIQNFIYHIEFLGFFYSNVYILGNNPLNSTAISSIFMFVVRFIDAI